MANIKEMLAAQPEVLEILTLAGELGAETGLEVYVVGGYVRDLFLNRPAQELDFMVVGDGIEFARALARRLKVGKVIPFPEFGTAKIPYRPFPLEVASARTERYAAGSRKPAQVHTTDLAGDLVRRDFTVNAMAVSLLPEQLGELHDPYGGLRDLQARRLVTPLAPEETFAEDPLRMLRAAYFSAALDLVIAENCLQALRRQAPRIGIVSPERVTAELLKILGTPQPSRGLIILQEVGLMQFVFPEVARMYGLEQPREWHHKDIFYHTLQVVDNVAQMSDKVALRLAALVHDIAKPHTRRVDPDKGVTFHGHEDLGARMLVPIARRLRLSNELRDYLVKLTSLHLRPIALAQEGVTDSAVRRLMVSAGDEADDLLCLCRADITTKNPRLVQRYLGNFERVERRMQDVQERDAMRAFQSPVRGDEIMEICGISEGKLVGVLKTAIEEAILNGEIDNTHAAAHRYLLEVKDRYLSGQ